MYQCKWSFESSSLWKLIGWFKERKKKLSLKQESPVFGKSDKDIRNVLLKGHLNCQSVKVAKKTNQDARKQPNY